MARNLNDLVAQKKGEFEKRQQEYAERMRREQEIKKFNDAVELRLSSAYDEYVDAVNDALFYDASDAECADALVVSILNDLEEVAGYYDHTNARGLIADMNYVYEKCIKSFNRLDANDNMALQFRHVFKLAFAKQVKAEQQSEAKFNKTVI